LSPNYVAEPGPKNTRNVFLFVANLGKIWGLDQVFFRNIFAVGTSPEISDFFQENQTAKLGTLGPLAPSNFRSRFLNHILYTIFDGLVWLG
jgi:hypothetical protein